MSGEPLTQFAVNMLVERMSVLGGNALYSAMPDVSRSSGAETWTGHVGKAFHGGRQPVTKMSSGRNADTSMFGASTTWLIFRSTATLQMA
jgi:hypothetical protein